MLYTIISFHIKIANEIISLWKIRYLKGWICKLFRISIHIDYVLDAWLEGVNRPQRLSQPSYNARPLIKSLRANSHSKHLFVSKNSCLCLPAEFFGQHCVLLLKIKWTPQSCPAFSKFNTFFSGIQYHLFHLSTYTKNTRGWK